MSSGARTAALLLGGVAIGFLATGTARLATQEHAHGVHYHANWAVFVDGQRLDLAGDRYMEDVFRCTADPLSQQPTDRVHMHENNPDIVHVHAAGVTWGALMANLGFALGDTYLFTDNARFENDEERSLTFVLNGMAVPSIHNRLIGDQDRLAISFGPEPADEVLEKQFPLVASDAGLYNTMPDPASCSGPLEPTLGERLRQAFWL